MGSCASSSTRPTTSAVTTRCSTRATGWRPGMKAVGLFRPGLACKHVDAWRAYGCCLARMRAEHSGGAAPEVHLRDRQPSSISAHRGSTRDQEWHHGLKGSHQLLSSLPACVKNRASVTAREGSGEGGGRAATSRRQQVLAAASFACLAAAMKSLSCCRPMAPGPAAEGAEETTPQRPDGELETKDTANVT